MNMRLRSQNKDRLKDFCFTLDSMLNHGTKLNWLLSNITLSLYLLSSLYNIRTIVRHIRNYFF